MIVLQIESPSPVPLSGPGLSAKIRNNLGPAGREKFVLHAEMLGKGPDQFNIQAGVCADHKIGVAHAYVPQFPGPDNRIQVAGFGIVAIG